MADDLQTRLSLIDKGIDFANRIGVPGGICAALLYILYLIVKDQGSALIRIESMLRNCPIGK